MTTEKPAFIRLKLSPIEKLLNEAVAVAMDHENAELAYIAGRVQGVIEGTISAVPQDCVDRGLTEEQQSLKKKIMDCPSF